MKKVFKIQIKIKNCDLIFKKGLDKGILGEYEVEYNLEEKEYKKPLFYKGLHNQAEELRKELIEFIIKEI